MDTQPTTDTCIAGHKRKLTEAQNSEDQSIPSEHCSSISSGNSVDSTSQQTSHLTSKWSSQSHRRTSSTILQSTPTLNYCSTDVKDVHTHHSASSEAKRPRRGSGSCSIRRVKEQVMQQVAVAAAAAAAAAAAVSARNENQMDIISESDNISHVNELSHCLQTTSNSDTFLTNSNHVSITSSSNVSNSSELLTPPHSAKPMIGSNECVFPSSPLTPRPTSDSTLSTKESLSTTTHNKRSKRLRKRAHSMPQMRTRPLYEFTTKTTSHKRHYPAIGGSHTTSCSSSSPSFLPPITRTTLRELDLSEILKNPQLRHDIIFDPNLQFRPNFDGERGQRKREQAERYWQAVEREVRGCCCDLVNTTLECQCPILRMRPDYTRVPFLIAELQAILLSLLFTNIPGDLDQHALITGMLDPELIAQELKHQILDVKSLVQFIGDTLKMHCAPMRDELVDRMVKTVCEDGNVVKGLRMCFEILECMKLDIANHQLRTLRPYLLDTAVEFEQKYFADQLERKAITFQRTITWLVKSWNKVHSTTTTTDESSPKGLQTVFAQGLLTLIIHRDFSHSLPESFHLDQYRIMTFHNEFIDIIILSLLLLLYRQLAGRNASNEEVMEIKREIWALLDDDGGRRTGPTTSIPGRHAQVSDGKTTWSTSMHNVVLQIVRRAKSKEIGKVYVPNASDVNLVNSWMERNLNADSALFKLVQTRIASHLESMLLHTNDKSIKTQNNNNSSMNSTDAFRRSSTFLKNQGVPCSVIAAGMGTNLCNVVLSKSSKNLSSSNSNLGMNGNGSGNTFSLSFSFSSCLSGGDLDIAKLQAHGLIQLSTEIKLLGERVRKLGNFHFSVFGGWYRAWIVEYLAKTS